MLKKKPVQNCIYKTINFWKEPETRLPVQVLGNINITGAGNLTLETVYIETGGGRYSEFVYKSLPRKKTAIKKNSTVSDKKFQFLSLTVEFFFIAFFFLVNFCIKTTDREFNQGYSTRDPISCRV